MGYILALHWWLWAEHAGVQCRTPDWFGAIFDSEKGGGGKALPTAASIYDGILFEYCGTVVMIGQWPIRSDTISLPSVDYSYSYTFFSNGHEKQTGCRIIIHALGL